MSVRLGTIPIDVSLSFRQTDDACVREVILHCRFPGRHNDAVSSVRPTCLASDGAVLGKIILTGDPLRHPQILAAALRAYRDRLETLKQTLPLSVASALGNNV